MSTFTAAQSSEEVHVPVKKSAVVTRAGLLVAGWLFIAISVSLLLIADLGTSPYDVFHTGIANKTGLPFSLTMLLGAAVLSFVGVAIKRKIPKSIVLTWVGLFVIGAGVDVFCKLLPDVTQMPYRALYVALAFVFVVIGASGMILSGAGPSPPDIVVLALAEKGMSVRAGKVAVDVFLCLIGWLLGGNLTLLTVFLTVAAGPALQFSLSKAPESINFMEKKPN